MGPCAAAALANGGTMKIYVSSTWQDLKPYRQAVYDQLRKLRLDAVAMEDFVAAEMRPLAQSIRDVSEADVYLGIFAWRYGYIPTEGNPERRSITELEYRAAGDHQKERLIFLLRDEAPWSPSLMDSHSQDAQRGGQIRRFREELTARHAVGYFSTPDELAKEVSAAITNALLNRPVSQTGQLVLSDVQVIQEPSQSCTLDFRVSNTLPVDVQINRLTLEVIDVHDGARTMGILEFSAIYDLDVSSLDTAGDSVVCNVSQVVKRGEVDRFGIRLAATELAAGMHRGWQLRPTLITSVGEVVGPVVEVWLPGLIYSGYSWDEIRQGKPNQPIGDVRKTRRRRTSEP